MDGATGLRPAWYRRVWATVSLVVVLALVEYVVLPKLTLARESLDRVTHLNPAWVIAAVALEASCLVSYSLFTRALLGRGQVRFSWILRTDVTGYGVSHVVPGGAATATALRFRLLRDGGARPDNITATITAEALGSYLALLLLACVPGRAAVLAVLSWRLVQFWAPVPVAGLCYLSLRAQSATAHSRQD